jgi:hypothetical protein
MKLIAPSFLLTLANGRPRERRGPKKQKGPELVAPGLPFSAF